MKSPPVCGDMVRRFLACLVGQPADHFECDPEGTASIKDGFCEAEQAEFASCLQRSAAQ